MKPANAADITSSNSHKMKYYLIRRESNFLYLQHFIAPPLNLMPCLSSWLEIIACLHSQGTKEAIRAVILNVRI